MLFTEQVTQNIVDKEATKEVYKGFNTWKTIVDPRLRT